MMGEKIYNIPTSFDHEDYLDRVNKYLEDCKESIRLSEAAKDLLEALIEARRFIGDGDMSDGECLPRECYSHEIARVVDMVDAAISKATGGEQ